jgi:hypothetical protein
MPSWAQCEIFTGYENSATITINGLPLVVSRSLDSSGCNPSEKQSHRPCKIREIIEKGKLPDSGVIYCCDSCSSTIVFTPKIQETQLEDKTI